MPIKAAIFDFNGTIFWDASINYRAWDTCIQRWLGRPFGLKEYHNLNGRTSRETIIEVYASSKLPLPGIEEIDRLVAEKDDAYFQVLVSMRSEVSLAPGLEELLEHLKNKGTQLAIATSANSKAMGIYDSLLGLLRFFPRENIIANDGLFRSKPAPDIYLHTIRSLGVSPSECMVFEDTVSGILSASRAGVGCIVAVCSVGSDVAAISAMQETTLSITNFTQVIFVPGTELLPSLI